MLRQWPCMILLILINFGCDQNHRYQSSFGNMEKEQLPPENTIPQSAKMEIPAVDMKSLVDGKRLFERTCIACHGITGEGNGIATKKGLTPPPSFTIDRLTKSNTDYFVKVMTYGLGRMPSYQRRLTLEERYKVAYYVQALQISRKFPAKILNQEDQRKMP